MKWESGAVTMKKQAFLYLVRVEVQKAAGFLLYAAGAGFAMTRAGTLYFAYLFIASLVIGRLLFKANEETLAERGKINTNSPLWDKILLPAFWIINYFLVYLFAGIAEHGEHMDLSFCFGIALTLFAAWFTTKATLENTFLESTARIQSDRDQTVCTTGPYHIVRHPTYSGVILNCLGVSMIFPYAAVWLCMLAAVIIIIARTALEDKMLMKGLKGYPDYANSTKYRLVPFIW